MKKECNLMKAVILAGGRGSRLEEFTKDKNKALLEIYSKTVLENNLDRAVEAKVKEIILVVGYQKEEMMKKFGNSYKGIKITYAIQKEQKGVVHAIETAKRNIGDSDFILMLGDEVLVDSDIKGMATKFYEEDLFGICGVISDKDKSNIRKTYSVMEDKTGRIFRLIEKPRFPINDLKGTGHCIFKNEILDYIERTPINMYRNQKEMTDMIQCAIDDGKLVKTYKIAKDYFNINTFEELSIAKESIKKSNPKVLIIHNQMKYFGGAELLIVEMCNWLTKSGIRNDVLTLSKSKEVEEKLVNTRIIIPHDGFDISPPGYKDIKDILKGIKIFRRELRKIVKNYDVINFHDFPTTWSLWPIKKPAVWFMNNPPNLYSKPNAGLFYRGLNKIRIGFDRFVVRHSVDIITVAETANQYRGKKRYGMNPRLIDFGINYELFSSGNAKEAIKKFKLENKFVIIQAGMICAVKNQLASIKAINQVKEKIPHVFLILAGKPDEEYKKELDKYIQENKLEGRILFTGNLKREDLTNLYKASSIGLFPITNQGGVLAPLEAASAGMPIIVSRELETASLIKKNELGIVTKDYDKAIVEIYNNKKDFEEKAKKAALFIKENLSWKGFSEKMAKAFKDAWKRY